MSAEIEKKKIENHAIYLEISTWYINQTQFFLVNLSVFFVQIAFFGFTSLDFSRFKLTTVHESCRNDCDDLAVRSLCRNSSSNHNQI